MKENMIEAAVARARQESRKLFIPFITAGYPDMKTTERLILMFDQAGADIIELGVPFSDPLADGPVIQHASQVALAKGVTLPKILALVKKVRPRVSCGIILFGAFNPFICYGEAEIIRDARSAGADGFLIPDAPPEDAEGFFRRARAAGLSTILLVAPTTTDERMQKIDRLSHPFVYCISVKGVTGVRQGVGGSVGAFLKRVRRNIRTPFVVGFGISTPADVRRIAAQSDGVVVGSGFIKTLTASARGANMMQGMRKYADSLITACKETRGCTKGRSAAGAKR